MVHVEGAVSIQCDCSADHDEECRCYLPRRIVARKEHLCCECRVPIARGQRYLRETGIDPDGDPFSYATCMPCAAIREHYCPKGWVWGGLAEQIEECIGWDYREDPPEDNDERFDGNVPVGAVA